MRDENAKSGKECFFLLFPEEEEEDDDDSILLIFLLRSSSLAPRARAEAVPGGALFFRMTTEMWLMVDNGDDDDAGHRSIIARCQKWRDDAAGDEDECRAEEGEKSRFPSSTTCLPLFRGGRAETQRTLDELRVAEENPVRRGG